MFFFSSQSDMKWASWKTVTSELIKVKMVKKGYPSELFSHLQSGLLFLKGTRDIFKNSWPFFLWFYPTVKQSLSIFSVCVIEPGD